MYKFCGLNCAGTDVEEGTGEAEERERQPLQNKETDSDKAQAVDSDCQTDGDRQVPGSDAARLASPFAPAHTAAEPEMGHDQDRYVHKQESTAQTPVVPGTCSSLVTSFQWRTFVNAGCALQLEFHAILGALIWEDKFCTVECSRPTNVLQQGTQSEVQPHLRQRMERQMCTPLHQLHLLESAHLLRLLGKLEGLSQWSRPLLEA